MSSFISKLENKFSNSGSDKSTEHGNTERGQYDSSMNRGSQRASNMHDDQYQTDSHYGSNNMSGSQGQYDSGDAYQSRGTTQQHGSSGRAGGSGLGSSGYNDDDTMYTQQGSQQPSQQRGMGIGSGSGIQQQAGAGRQTRSQASSGINSNYGDNVDQYGSQVKGGLNRAADENQKYVDRNL